MILKLLKKKLRKDNYLERLVSRGMKVGKNFNMYETKIDYSHCFLIEIGDDVTITNSTILAHDATTKRALGKSKVGKVKIGDRVFIGWGSIILPNVNIGNDSIIAAGSVVTKDVPSNSIVAGVPARVISKTSEYIERNKNNMSNAPVYETNWRFKTEDEIQKMVSDLDNITGYDD